MLGNIQGITTLPLAASIVPTEVEEEDGGRSDAGNTQGAYTDDVTSRQAYRLYVSHSLSMWNSRMYEFAVVSIKIHGLSMRGY